MSDFDVIVIGGGPAGMMAAGTAAARGRRTALLEKNEKLGKKLYITGKGRCNITNASEPQELIDNIPGNPEFLYSALYTLTPEGLVEMLKDMGLPTKQERGRRVFPLSDKASDVCRALAGYMKAGGVTLRLNAGVGEILSSEGRVRGVRLVNGEVISAESVIIATGGLSYPQTGSTGDGHRFAKAIGHRVTRLFPSLVSLASPEPFIPELEGLSLRNVGVRLVSGKKTLFGDMGELLFTFKGVSGPVILSASRYAGAAAGQRLRLLIDLKPALDEAALDKRLLRDFEKYANKDFRNALADLLPQKLAPVIVALTGIEPEKKTHDITKAERRALLELLKGFELEISGTGGFDEAVITAGGVEVVGIDPSTMRSKLVEGLYFAGEVIDVDGFTGGYNLQIAFSTGYLAGGNA